MVQRNVIVLRVFFEINFAVGTHGEATPINEVASVAFSDQKSDQQLPKSIQIMAKTIIVPKQPPPNFLAPYPAINPLKMLFMMF